MTKPRIELLEAFQKAEASLWEANAPLLEAYLKGNALLRKAYEEAKAPFWEAYQKANALLLEAFQKAEAPLWEAYQKALSELEQ